MGFVRIHHKGQPPPRWLRESAERKWRWRWGRMLSQRWPASSTPETPLCWKNFVLGKNEWGAGLLEQNVWIHSHGEMKTFRMVKLVFSLFKQYFQHLAKQELVINFAMICLCSSVHTFVFACLPLFFTFFHEPGVRKACSRPCDEHVCFFTFMFDLHFPPSSWILKWPKSSVCNGMIFKTV